LADDTQLVLIANVFRIVCLVAGLIFAYLGYRLYVKGVFDKTQDIQASFGNAKVALRHVAPGVVFGIAGIVVALLSVVRPIEITTTTVPGSRHIPGSTPNEEKHDQQTVTLGNRETITLEDLVRLGLVEVRPVSTKKASMKEWTSKSGKSQEDATRLFRQFSEQQELDPKIKERLKKQFNSGGPK
jgi:hypothetical protein